MVSTQVPYSSDEHVQTVREWFAEWAPQDHPHAGRVKVRILDVGAGAGLNRDRYADAFPASGAYWTALEIWEPYVERFDLKRRYDEVIVADVRSLPEPVEGAEPHVILLGDVLEHLAKRDALAVWSWARETVGRFGLVIATLPIVHWPQGEEEGNPHEAHLYHWTEDEFWRTFPGISESAGTTDQSQTGAFMAYGTES